MRLVHTFRKVDRVDYVGYVNMVDTTNKQAIGYLVIKRQIKLIDVITAVS